MGTEIWQEWKSIQACAFKPATPMGNRCLIPLGLQRNFTKSFGNMAKYTRSGGEKQIPLGCHFSLAEGGSVNMNCSAISGRACMSEEHIPTCTPHDVPQQQMPQVGTRDKGWFHVHGAGQILWCIWLVFAGSSWTALSNSTFCNDWNCLDLHCPDTYGSCLLKCS